MFLVSYDVNSLFTNIPLCQRIDLAVNAIIDGSISSDLKLNKLQHKQLFNFATTHTHFSMVVFTKSFSWKNTQVSKYYIIVERR